MPNECVSEKFVTDLATKLNTDKKEEVDAARKMFEDCKPAIAMEYAAQRVVEQKKLLAEQNGKDPEEDDMNNKPDAKDQVKAMKMAPEVYDQASEAFVRRVDQRQLELKQKK